VDGLLELARDQWGMKKLMRHIEGLLAPFPAGDNDESAEEDEGIALVDEPAPRIQAGACICCVVAHTCVRVCAFSYACALMQMKSGRKAFFFVALCMNALLLFHRLGPLLPDAGRRTVFHLAGSRKYHTMHCSALQKATSAVVAEGVAPADKTLCSYCVKERPPSDPPGQKAEPPSQLSNSQEDVRTGKHKQGRRASLDHVAIDAIIAKTQAPRSLDSHAEDAQDGVMLYGTEGGGCYHARRDCGGLKAAKDVLTWREAPGAKRPCKLCAK
jgi:hypothetical protein